MNAHQYHLNVHRLETPVSRRDLPALRRLNQLFLHDTINPREADDKIIEVADNPSQQLLVARRLGRVAGMAILTIKNLPEPGVIDIDAMAVAAKYKLAEEPIDSRLIGWAVDYADGLQKAIRFMPNSTRNIRHGLLKTYGFYPDDSQIMLRRPVKG